MRSLESSHKELIGALKNAADGVAEEFRQLEKKVHENYLAVRRNVLAQVFKLLFSQASQPSFLTSSIPYLEEEIRMLSSFKKNSRNIHN